MSCVNNVKWKSRLKKCMCWCIKSQLVLTLLKFTMQIAEQISFMSSRYETTLLDPLAHCLWSWQICAHMSRGCDTSHRMNAWAVVVSGERVGRDRNAVSSVPGWRQWQLELQTNLREVWSIITEKTPSPSWKRLLPRMLLISWECRCQGHKGRAYCL